MTILLVLKVKENYAFKINLKAWWCDVVCLVFGSERERERGRGDSCGQFVKLCRLTASHCKYLFGNSEKHFFYRF